MTTNQFIEWYGERYDIGGVLNLDNYRECEYYIRGMAAMVEDGETAKHLFRCADVIFHAGHLIEKLTEEK